MTNVNDPAVGPTDADGHFLLSGDPDATAGTARMSLAGPSIGARGVDPAGLGGRGPRCEPHRILHSYAGT